MSPANETSDDATQCVSKAATGTRPRRRPIFVCAVLLSAFTFPAAVPSRAQPTVQKPQLQTPEKARRLELVADRETVSLCPGEPSSVRLAVKGDFGERGQLTHEWRASGGNVKGDARGAVWELSGLKAGTYTTTLTVKLFTQPGTAAPSELLARGSQSVKVERCQAPEHDRPAQTVSSTPAASPSPSPSPAALAVATPQTTPPTPSGTPDTGSMLFGGNWLIALVPAALGALALLAGKFLFSGAKGRYWGRFSDTTLPTAASSTSTVNAPEHEGAAVIFGGQKKTDVVHCTVFAPLRVAPGEQFFVQVFAHLARQAKQAAEKAARADAVARERGSRSLVEKVERGTLLTFTLEAPGLNVNESHRRGESLVWRGVPESVQFAVDVPEGFATPRPVRCTARILSGEARAPVGHIMFMLDVVTAAAPPQPPLAETSAPSLPPQTVKRYTHAFISYCSKDRLKVMPIYLGKRTEWRKAGITDFFDRKDIGAGEVWNEEIRKNLDQCDLFVLFWSSSARGSEGVAREIAYALGRKTGDEGQPPTFDPLSLELPVPRPLPTGLESLNFDDPLLYFIRAEEAIREEEDASRPRPDGGAGT